jgi:hypothetical protein
VQDEAAAEPEAEGIDGDVEVPVNQELPPRMRQPSKYLMDACMLLCAVEKPDEPETFQAALTQPGAELWCQSADDGMASLRLLEVFKVVDPCHGNPGVQGSDTTMKHDAGAEVCICYTLWISSALRPHSIKSFGSLKSLSLTRGRRT